MNAFLDQLPTLIGVAIGTLGTILATSVSDRAKWTRAQAVRWDERRVDAYATFARAVKEMHLVAMRLTRSSPTETAEREADLHVLDEADNECSKAWEGVLLLGDAATVDAGRNWREAAYQLVAAARGRTDDRFDREAAVRDTDEGRDRFYAAARASLAVGGAVAQAHWLTQRRRPI
ncbi:hypothetical protein [Micromonospora sp. CPCC 206061]|uniref:hypothetical protein n=1 Tax=Micromonospora sp. CPCC 206061 TaxID=3122410 RepID=UPI002FF0E1A4